MDRKNILKSMINGGKAALSVATNPAAAAYKAVQGVRGVIKSRPNGMNILGKTQPSIANMPTIKGGKGAYVSPNTNAQDNAMRVRKAITGNAVKSFKPMTPIRKTVDPMTTEKMRVPSTSPTVRRPQPKVDLKYR